MNKLAYSFLNHKFLNNCLLTEHLHLFSPHFLEKKKTFSQYE